MPSKFFNNLAATIPVTPDEIGIPKVPLNDNTLATVMSAVFVLIGGMAVLFLLVGAVRYATSNGDQGNIKKAKDTILFAIVGLVVSTLAFTIVQFTLGKISGSI
jgi:Ca2+/H+ antiporter